MQKLIQNVISQVFLLAFLLCTTHAVLACDCDTPKPIYEYKKASHVFVGTIESKKITNDSSFFNLKVKVEKAYKWAGKQKKFIVFRVPVFDNTIENCYYSIDKQSEWLIYAKTRDGELYFNGFICSNSKPTNQLEDSDYNALKQMAYFNTNNYVFKYDKYIFNKTEPITNLDSLVGLYSEKKYAINQAWHFVIADYDTTGRLIKANNLPRKGAEFSKDTIFQIITMVNKEYVFSQNSFERDVLELVRQITEWEVMKDTSTGKAVKQRVSFRLYTNSEGRLILDIN